MSTTDVGEVEGRGDLGGEAPVPGAVYQGRARRLHRGHQVLAFHIVEGRESHPNCGALKANTLQVT
jgi:hypothetical protein